MDAQELVSPDGRLFGRQRELDQLSRALEAAAVGKATVALLAGEPGIGKTRLLDVAAARAAQAGMRVLRGGTSDAEGMPPYLPLLEALGQHIRVAPAEVLRRQADALAPVLATVLPDLAVRLGDLPSTYPLPPEQARFRLFQAIERFVGAIAEDRPLLLILDDLHWADPASLDALRYLISHRQDARLLVAGAYREGEVEHARAFDRTLADLARLRVLRTIRVERLAPDEVGALATARLGAPLDRMAQRLLFDHSEGNPFFAEELVRAWSQSGRLTRRAGLVPSYGLAAAAVGEAVPSTLVGAVRQRLTRLSPATVDVLRAAAIVGRAFDLDLLADVSELEPELVETHLVEAVRAQIIRRETPRGEAVATFAFRHDKIRECLYDEVTVTRRRRLHDVIGHALEARPAPNDAQRLAELAFHFARGGDRARGIRYALEAAEHAARASAPAEMMAHVRTALSLVEADDPRRGGLLLRLGEAALLAGAEPEAVSAFQDAERWARASGDTRMAARAAQQAGRAWWRQEAIHEARAAFEAAFALLDPRPGAELVSVLVDLGGLLVENLHRRDEGLAHARRALDLARRLGDDRLVVMASRALGNLLARSNHLAAGVALLEDALALARALDDPVEEAEACACLASASFWQGALRRSRDVTIRRLALAERTHDAYQLRHVHSWLAFVGAFLGDMAEVDAQLDRAESIIERLASPEPLGFLRFVQGVVAVLRGEHAPAERRFAQSAGLFRAIGPGALVWYLGNLGLPLAVLGRVAEAHTCMDEVEALLAGLPEATMAACDAYVYMVATALALGDRDRLARYAPKLIPFRGQFHDMLTDRLLGEVALAQGDRAAAQEYVVAAEATARREGLVYELARILEAQIAVSAPRARGSPAVRAALDEARRLYQHLGNQAEAARLEQRLREPARAARPVLPAGLTGREAEVLRLVAAGRSNREIAEALVVSEKTVENHLTNAYTKIGAENRAAAAAFAVRHGLT
jgi:ATP/maltotriose-dependent transcriptional regulator MalT